MSPNKSLQKVQKVRKDEKVRQTKTCKHPFNLTSFLMVFKIPILRFSSKAFHTKLADKNLDFGPVCFTRIKV